MWQAFRSEMKQNFLWEMQNKIIHRSWFCDNSIKLKCPELNVNPIKVNSKFLRQFFFFIGMTEFISTYLVLPGKYSAIWEQNLHGYKRL